MVYAECAFHNAGMGVECENCGCLVGIGSSRTTDKFVEPIKQYYKDIDYYEAVKKKLTPPPKIKEEIENLKSSLTSLMLEGYLTPEIIQGWFPGE